MSILGVDFGNIYTRAVLLDMVDGVYQLVARARTRTTDSFPVGDINVGLDRVLRELGDATGRTFTDADGNILMPEQANRSGVDVFTTTASAGRPLRAVIIGLMPDFSLASAIRAAAGTYADVMATLHLDDGRSEQDRLNAIVLQSPDVILIAGGTEAGAEEAVREMLKLVQVAISLIDESRRPLVLYAGNSALQAVVEGAFKDLTPILIAPNVRPTLDNEQPVPLQESLGQAFDKFKEERSPDFARVAAMSQRGLQPTARHYATIVEYLAKAQKGNVATLDVGSANAILSVATRGKVATTIRSDLGLGHSALRLLATIGAGPIRRWLPFTVTTGELLNYLANKSLRPMTIPATLRELYIEHALLRAAMQFLLDTSRPAWGDPLTNEFDLVIGAGSPLCGIGHPAYTALLLLDVLQPTGVSTIMLDPFALVPVLGSLAAEHPEAVVQVLDEHNLEYAGMSFCLNGIPRLDKPALRVKITLASGEVIDNEINGGHLWVYPLPVGQTAEVRVRAAGRGLSMGGRRGVRVKVTGGTAGLIFDARGRPLPLAGEVRERAVQMPQWVAEATGDTLQEIDPRWLYEVEPAVIEEAAKQRAQRTRRGLFGRGRRDEAADAMSALEDRLAGVEAGADDLDAERDALRELRDASLS